MPAKRIPGFFIFAIVFIPLWVGSSVSPGMTSGEESGTAVIAPGTRMIELGPLADVLVDADNTFSLEYVSSPKADGRWLPNESQNIAMPASGGVYWIRFKLRRSPAGEAETWMLETGRFFGSFFREIDLYVPVVETEPNQFRVSYRSIETGYSRPLKNDPYVYRTYVIRLPEEFADGDYFYLRLTGPDDMEEPLTLWAADALWISSVKSMIVPLLAYGALCAMIVYNLFLLLTLYERSYLYYVAYIFTLMAWQVMAQGHLHLVYRFPPGTFLPADYLTGRICILTSVVFIRFFLDTRRKTPIIDKIFLLLMGLTTISIIQVLLRDYRPLLGNIIGLSMGWVMMAAAIARYRQGFQPALQIIFAWSFMMAGTLIYFLRGSGFLPATQLTVNAMLIGAALEAIFISFALGSRIRALRRAKTALEASERLYREMSNMDELTGLYNKRYLMNKLDEEVRQAGSLGTPFSLIMLDVDHFKQYNDKYGHLEGDKVLAALGKTLVAMVRGIDTSCRYGGEEFAVLLPGVNLREAFRVAERIRDSFSLETFEPVPNEKISVTVSFGVAELSPGDNVDILISKADRALYQAKKLGRNRTETASL